MANLTENLKDAMTATFPREFDIPNAMTTQEIYDKLNARAAAFQMPFSVKGGIPGERVVFEKEPNLDVTIWLHVKDGTHIKITPVTQDSSAKINGIDVGKNSVMRKGVKGILYLFTGGLFGIGWLIDLVKIATGKFTDKNGNVVQKV